MHCNGIDVTVAARRIVISETCHGVTPSWAAMTAFCEKHPTGHEPEWDAFIKRHTAMQRRETDNALRQYRASRK